MNFGANGLMALHALEPRLYSPPNDRPSQDLRRRPREVTGSEDGRAQTRQRHPHRPGQAEEGPESGQGEHPHAAPRPARVRADRQGLRHAARGPQVRPGEDEPDPQPVPDLAVEDDRRPLRAAARRAASPSSAASRPLALRRVTSAPGRDVRSQGLRHHWPLGGRQGHADLGAARARSRTSSSRSRRRLASRARARSTGAITTSSRRDEFDQRIEAEDFLEFATYSGHRYGTLRSEVDGASTRVTRSCSRSRSRARARCARRCASRFRFSSPRRTRRRCAARLESRGTDSLEAIDARLEVAEQELAAQDEFAHRVVNDDLEPRRRRAGGNRARRVGDTSRLRSR